MCVFAEEVKIAFMKDSVSGRMVRPVECSVLHKWQAFSFQDLTLVINQRN